MLVRKGYSTQVLRGYEWDTRLAAVGLGGQLFEANDWDVLLVSSSLTELASLEVWRVLITNETAGNARTAQIVLGETDAGVVGVSVPRSLLSKVFLADRKCWPSFEPIYAWQLKSRLLMVGYPTEEAWQEFSNALS